jgi:hypothetical protein
MTAPSQHTLRDVVARADQQRRSRLVDQWLSKTAPYVAGGMVLLALAGRLAGWPRWLPLAGLVFSAVVLLWLVVQRKRTQPTTDAIASAVDTDAALNGELRSAHWFETSPEAGERDAWATYHMDQAADRAGRVDWAALYPAVSSGRQWAGTAALALAVIVLSVSLPTRLVGAPSGAPAGLDPTVASQLPPDLAKKLAALMAQLEASELDKNAKLLSLEEMKAMMAKLDPATQKKLAELLEKAMAKGEMAKADPKDSRPERAENSAAGLPEDVRWAQEDLAQRAAQASDDRKTNPNNPSASSETGEKGTASAQAEQKAGATADSATPMMREAAADPGGKMMMGGGGPMGGDSRPGAGGNQGAQQGAAEALLLAQALKKETLEANADALGENVDKDDLRKKTEQGKSTLGYTRVETPRTFDPSRAAAPPPVPEARRQLLLNYFIRKR